MGHRPREAAKRRVRAVGLSLSIFCLGYVASLPFSAVAMHEVDHRFIVEGHVCGPDGQPVPDQIVVVKDVRLDAGVSALTDSRGYYQAKLHLHNENKGDPIRVTVGEEEQRITAQFDTEDVSTERRTVVNFGKGCESLEDEFPGWLYYGAGIGVVAIGALAGAKLLKSRRQSRKGGKKRRR